MSTKGRIGDTKSPITGTTFMGTWGGGGGGMLVKRMSTCSHSDCPDHISVKLVAGEHIIVVEVLGVVTGCAV